MSELNLVEWTWLMDGPVELDDDIIRLLCPVIRLGRVVRPVTVIHLGPDGQPAKRDWRTTTRKNVMLNATAKRN
jgi:hypothetical protein